ncbi:GNAT family N-acetyltransferase [Streptosporangium sp. NPDC051022]|uniref:GNAT family N-acetyltransferase n=1 Tax=Streptosporangium sp. NPDC051022 TaxID=3155752 RepID=UPI0034432E65
MEILLTTARLTLRRFTETEANVDRLLELHNDPEVMRFLNGGVPTSRDTVRDEVLPRFLRRYDRFADPGFWAAEERDGGEFVGWFEFRPLDGEGPGEVELGYRLHRRFWGRGYATEGARALIHRGFTELGVRRVMAQTMAVNTASRRVMEKSGLSHVRTFHEDWPHPIEGSEHGEVEYELTELDRRSGEDGPGHGADGAPPA